MARAMDVSILVRLVDRVTGPLRALQRVFERFSALAQRIGILGGAIAAISFMTPIAQAAQFDQKLRDMVVTAGLFGDAAEQRIAGVKRELFDLALQVGLTADTLTDAMSSLTSAGMSDAEASRLMGTIGRVAKAASALPADVAKVGFELSTTFGIAADQLEANFAKLIVAGKLGRFEFKDMAKAIPTLSNALKGLGVTGSEAVAHMGAALQVAMLGADSAESAANNYKNFLQKVLAPDARKNFRELGVDISGVMSKAIAQGINPVEAALDKVATLTGASEKEINAIFKSSKSKGKTDAEATEDVKARIKAIMGRTKLGELFADTQVLDFLVPMMLNRAKYREFKEAIKSAGLDEMARDFATQMAGLGTQQVIFNQILDIFKDRVGIAFGKNLTWINAGLQRLLGWVREVDASFPGLIDKVLTFGGGALVLVTVLGLMGPVFSVLAAGIGVVAGVIGALLTPVGLLAAALAGAAVIIWANWDQIAPMFSGIWKDVQATFSEAVAGIQALFAGDWAGAGEAYRRYLAGLGRIGSGVMSVLGKVGRIVWDWAMNQLPAPWREGAEKAVALLATAFGRIGRVFRGVGIMLGSAATTIGERLSGVAQWARDSWDGFLSWLGSKGGSTFAAVASAAGQAWDAIKTKASEVWDWLRAKIAEMSTWSDDDWRQLGVRLGNAVMDGVEGLIAWASALPGRIGAAISGAASTLMEAGRGLIQDLWNGAQAKFEELLAWVTSIPGRIKAAIGSIDLSSMIKWPSLPSWAGGGSVGPAEGANDNAPPAAGTAPAAPQRQSFAPAPGGRSMADAGFAAAGTVTRSAAAPAAAGQAEVSGRIVVEAAPGTRVREATTENKSVAMVAGRGQVIGRA